MVELLVDVLVEIGHERSRQQDRRPAERRAWSAAALVSGNGGADDLVLLDQVLGPELAEPRVVHELRAGSRERADRERDLPAKPNAGRVESRGLRLGQWITKAYECDSQPAACRLAPTRSSRSSSSGVSATSVSYTLREGL